MVQQPADRPEASGDTSDLLDRARAGDAEALNELFTHQVPVLRRWASGRLPHWARDIADTTDLVQETVVEALKHLDRFEHRGDGALQAYLRQAVINRIRNEIRKLAVRGSRAELDPETLDQGESPMDAAIAAQLLEQYEAGLQQLGPDEREAVVARIEFGMSYGEIATALNKPTANAARMTVVRALVRLAEVMKG
jgi:RNA polymerase sigma-70 factor (ECF subfamily)